MLSNYVSLSFLRNAKNQHEPGCFVWNPDQFRTFSVHCTAVSVGLKVRYFFESMQSFHPWQLEFSPVAVNMKVDKLNFCCILGSYFHSGTIHNYVKINFKQFDILLRHPSRSLSNYTRIMYHLFTS